VRIFADQPSATGPERKQVLAYLGHLEGELHKGADWLDEDSTAGQLLSQADEKLAAGSRAFMHRQE
jgi:hypothetical protein